MSPRPYLVILTGGGLPSDSDQPPDPYATQIAPALDLYQPECSCCTNNECECGGAKVTSASAVAAAAFKAGYHQAALLHRVVAVYAVEDPAEAQMLAAAVTREIDPAYVTHAASPLAEALSCYRQARQAADEQVPDAEIVDAETGKETA